MPFSSIKGFFDPSVQFGLQFDPVGAKADDEDENDGDDREGAANGDSAAESEKPGEKVVSLDSFRKKP